MTWIRIRKNTSDGLSTLKFGVYNAVTTFNEGIVIKREVPSKCSLTCRNRMADATK